MRKRFIINMESFIGFSRKIRTFNCALDLWSQIRYAMLCNFTTWQNIKKLAQLIKVFQKIRCLDVEINRDHCQSSLLIHREALFYDAAPHHRWRCREHDQALKNRPTRPWWRTVTFFLTFLPHRLVYSKG